MGDREDTAGLVVLIVGFFVILVISMGVHFNRLDAKLDAICEQVECVEEK